MTKILIVENICRKIVSQFRGIAKLILLEGSWSWGGANESSDLDLEIIIDNFKSLKNLPHIKELHMIIEGLEECLKNLEKSSGIDILQTKTIIKGIDVGVRVIETKTFEKMSKINLSKRKRSVFLLSIRDTERKNQKIYYNQRNFKGGYKRFNKKFWIISKKQFTQVPFVLFDETGHFYPGSLMDRYLSVPRILFDQNGFGKDILETIKYNVVCRYFTEKQKFNVSEKTNIFSCLSRWEVFPFEVKQKLLQEENESRKFYLNKQK